MGKIILCDLCREEDGKAMWTSLTDGTVVTVGENCVSVFVMGLAVSMGIMPDPTETPAEPAPRKSRAKRSQTVLDATNGPDAPDGYPEPVGEPVEA